MLHLDFTGRTAVVTGASKGIGRRVAITLASAGANVIGIGRDRQRLDQFDEFGTTEGGDIRGMVCDLESQPSIREVSGRILERMPRLDILVHSAGIIHTGNIETADVALFDRQFAVNVRASYLLTQYLLPALKRARGQVVFINSTAGLCAGAGVSQYAATKHALKAIADSLRQEVNDAGVRVLSVYPGRTDTPMQKTLLRQEGRPYDPSVLIHADDVANSICHAIALPPNAQVTDLTILPSRRLR